MILDIDKLMSEKVISIDTQIKYIKDRKSTDTRQNHIDVFNTIFEKDNPSKVIRRLSELQLLGEMLPELEESRNVVQKKRTALNLFTHTLRVIDIAQKPYERWAAMFHDLGKIKAVSCHNLSCHAQYSADIFRKYVAGQYLEDSVLISEMVARHMEPYQFPKWKLQTAIDWVTNLNARGIVQLTIYDKVATNPLYVGALNDLMEICRYTNMSDRVDAVRGYYKCHRKNLGK